MERKDKIQGKKNGEQNVIISPAYQALIEEIKARIQTAQNRAARAIHQELVLLYYDVGKQILEREEKEGWGASVIERLASDLRVAFPGLKGFSPRNLRYMKTLAFDYPEAEFRNSLIAQIPWGHLMKILDASKDQAERMFYMRQTLEHGWSQRVLDHHMHTKLYQRQGKALTNFSQTLPSSHAHSAQQILKDPYIFDFLDLGDQAEEREIERELMNKVEKFLLELGTGFALVGRQYHLKIANKDRYIDLLFYHFKLRCFVVIELKARAFDPADSGQLNFYLSAIDDLLKHPQDNPSIGLILCKAKDKIEAEYALRDLHKPIGISTYELSILESLPENLKSQLPSIEELEQTLSLGQEKEPEENT